LRTDSLDLPGLHADALIPILAKVEFDIDRPKAACSFVEAEHDAAMPESTEMQETEPVAPGKPSEGD
jgi:hypothetical protein